VTAAVRHVGRNLPREPWFGKIRVRCRFDQPLDEDREIRVHQTFAHHERPPVAGVEPPTRFGERQDRLQDFEQVGLFGVQRDSVTRESDRGREYSRERYSAETAVDVQVAGQATRHRNRAEPHVEHLIGVAEANGHGLEIELLRRLRKAPTRRIDEEIEQPRIARGGSGQQESAAAQPGKSRFHHGGSEAGRHGGVERIASAPENLRGGFTCRRMAGRHNTPFRSRARIHAPTVARQPKISRATATLGLRRGQ